MGGFRLVITEKPSVARDIARVLGVSGRERGAIGRGALRIAWCLGHMLELAPPAAYDPAWKPWRLETLPMIPPTFKLQPREESADQWKVLSGLLRSGEVEDVINACDAGREGELIFAYVYQASGCTAPVQRLWISSMTDGAIRDGFAALRPAAEMATLEAAARCRSEADWLVGLNATRAMTLRLRRGRESRLLSLGRVQTPTLALLARREDEIEGFEPRTFFQVRVKFAAERGEWEAQWSRPDLKEAERNRTFDRAEAEAVLSRIEGRDGVVQRAEGRRSKERPPLLYDLTTLQKEANARFRFSAQRTLDLAQSLYERRKVITYPRTDSRHLGSDMIETLPDRLRALAFGPYEGAATDILQRWPFTPGPRVVDDSEVSDHHAIIPTGVEPRTAGLDADEKRLFDLVARRFLAVFMAPAEFALMQLDTAIGDDLFSARGRSCLEPGWQAIDPPRSKRRRGEDKKELVLPAVKKGEQARQLAASLHEARTKAPRRYTEATLLGAMENAGEGLEDAELKRAMKRNGLGTPATRAAIIETLLRRGYVEREKAALCPTAEGRALIRLLPVEALRSPALTGGWEARLNAIAEGQQTREQFMEDICVFLRQAVEQIVGAEIEEAAAELLAAPPPAEGEQVGDCPLCSGKVLRSERGWRCTGCSLSIASSIARREISPRMAQQLLRERVTRPVKGFRSRQGKEFRAALKLTDEGRIEFEFPEPESLGSCPACGSKVTQRGRVFTCATGRECPFVVFAEMSGRCFTEQEVRELLELGATTVLEGFSDRQGREFCGRLRWSGTRVEVERVDPRAEAGPAGSCPRCGGEVRFSRGKWRCAGGDLDLPASVARRELRPAEVGALLSEGRTPRLEGFRRKSGTVFKAALVLDPASEQVLSFDYARPKDERPPPLPPGAPAPAFGRRLVCPACRHRADPDPGYVIEGKSAWGCSKWREGCGMRVPFVIEGQRLSEKDACRLLGKERRTRYLRGLHGPRGNLPVSRVVLAPGDEPCWRLEARGPARSPEN